MLFTPHDPEACANIPYPCLTIEQEEKCQKKCSVKDHCCFYECLAQLTGIMANGTYHSEVTFKEYEYYFIRKNSYAVEREAWMPVLKKSVEKCEKLSIIVLIVFQFNFNIFPIFVTVTKSKDVAMCSSIPAEHLTIQACAYQINFLNSPAAYFKSTNECVAIKKFIQTESNCGHKYNDTFIINEKFWWPRVEENRKTDDDDDD